MLAVEHLWQTSVTPDLAANFVGSDPTCGFAHAITPVGMSRGDRGLVSVAGASNMRAGSAAQSAKVVHNICCRPLRSMTQLRMPTRFPIGDQDLNR